MSEQAGNIAIVGVGLLGGSVAKAVQQRTPATTVVGIGRDAADLADAQQLGLLDEAGCDVSLVANADIIVVCTPVDRIAIDVLAASAHAKANAVITDVGSVKGTIVTELHELAAAGRFVGSHPMAGSEKSGYQNADAELFADANCIVCPTEETPTGATNTVIAFWQTLGATVATMPAEEHDKIVAEISHLPHAVAAALARTPDSRALPFAATGFADTTRIANGNPNLWAAIFEANQGAVLKSIQQFEAELSALREAIEAGQQSTGEYLSQARRFERSE